MENARFASTMLTIIGLYLSQLNCPIILVKLPSQNNSLLPSQATDYLTKLTKQNGNSCFYNLEDLKKASTPNRTLEMMLSELKYITYLDLTDQRDVDAEIEDLNQSLLSNCSSSVIKPHFSLSCRQVNKTDIIRMNMLHDYSHINQHHLCVEEEREFLVHSLEPPSNITRTIFSKIYKEEVSFYLNENQYDDCGGYTGFTPVGGLELFDRWKLKLRSRFNNKYCRFRCYSAEIQLDDKSSLSSSLIGKCPVCVECEAVLTRNDDYMLCDGKFCSQNACYDEQKNQKLQGHKEVDAQGSTKTDGSDHGTKTSSLNTFDIQTIIFVGISLVFSSKYVLPCCEFYQSTGSQGILLTWITLSLMWFRLILIGQTIRHTMLKHFPNGYCPFYDFMEDILTPSCILSGLYTNDIQKLNNRDRLMVYSVAYVPFAALELTAYLLNINPQVKDALVCSLRLEKEMIRNIILGCVTIILKFIFDRRGGETNPIFLVVHWPVIIVGTLYSASLVMHNFSIYHMFCILAFVLTVRSSSTSLNK